MTLPGFRAEAAIYRSGIAYQVAWGAGEAPGSRAVPLHLVPMETSGAVVPALSPGPSTQHDCYTCTSGAAGDAAWCHAIAIGTGIAACAGLGWLTFGLSCAAAAEAVPAALAAWDLTLAIEWGECLGNHCCPKSCGSQNPFDPGSGCCDEGEQCVDEKDPNARQGCCPVGQSVCGGICCPPNHKCCGDSCCPNDWKCEQGTCCPPDTKTVCNGFCCKADCDQPGTCCEPPGDICGGLCSPPLNRCCNGQCCPLDQDCHPTLGTCCPIVCGPNCCPDGQYCLDSNLGTCGQCPPGQHACF